MNVDEAYSFFERSIVEAKNKLLGFTLSSQLTIDNKADKSLVTECDRQIDSAISEIAREKSLQVVSEEGKHELDIVGSGNYVTIDPIDGTLGYIDYVNHAIEDGDINNFLKVDLGAEHDFCILLGIVENGSPRFAACYNFVTNEKILLDSISKENFVRENNTRKYTAENAIYLDQRFSDDPIIKELLALPGVTPIKQATFGLKSIYSIINPHKNAITLHRVQTAGLWDVLPAAVATKVFGGNIYDELGEPLTLTEYIILPGNGGIIIKGKKFEFALEMVRSTSKH